MKFTPLVIKNKFEEFLIYLAKKGLTEKTITENRRFLYGAIQHSSLIDKKLKHLKLTDVVSVIEAGKVHGEYGSQRAVSVFRCYLRFLKESGIKLPVDYRDIILPKVPHKEQPFFEEKELYEILDKFKLDSPKVATRKMEWTMKALCETLYSTGMRISEALTLRRLEFEEICQKREVVIRGAKNGDEGRVFFTQRCIMWLEKYLIQRTDICPAMFVNSFGEPLLVVTAKSHIMRFRLQFGEKGKKIKFHTFRRSLSNLLIEKGIDIKSVQTILRHKSERTTIREYAKTNPTRAKEVYLGLLDRDQKIY